MTYAKMVAELREDLRTALEVEGAESLAEQYGVVSYEDDEELVEACLAVELENAFK